MWIKRTAQNYSDNLFLHFALCKYNLLEYFITLLTVFRYSLHGCLLFSLILQTVINKFFLNDITLQKENCPREHIPVHGRFSAVVTLTLTP